MVYVHIYYINNLNFNTIFFFFFFNFQPFYLIILSICVCGAILFYLYICLLFVYSTVLELVSVSLIYFNSSSIKWLSSKRLCLWRNDWEFEPVTNITIRVVSKNFSSRNISSILAVVSISWTNDCLKIFRQIYRLERVKLNCLLILKRFNFLHTGH